jgi:hypothetical protein
MSFELRIEAFNTFNRTVMPDPDGSNSLLTAVRDANGNVTSGFGRINPSAIVAGSPRHGQLLARFRF